MSSSTSGVKPLNPPPANRTLLSTSSVLDKISTLNKNIRAINSGGQSRASSYTLYRVPTQRTATNFRTLQHYKYCINNVRPSRSFLIAKHKCWLKYFLADFLSSMRVFQLFLSLHQITTLNCILLLYGNYIAKITKSPTWFSGPH